MVDQKGRLPTSRELVAARKAQAPAAEAAPAVPAVQSNDAKLVAEYRDNYALRYLSEIAPASISGRLVKFKDASYQTTDDGRELPEDAEYVFLADETFICWVKFDGPGALPEKIGGLLFDGFELPDRASLGDTDESKWEMGLSGHPADPWQHQVSLVFQQTGGGELFTFVTGSITGRKACGNLLRHAERMKRTHPDELPVVKFAKGGFKHKDSRVGWVDVPLFTVVGRAPRDSVAKPDTSTEAYLDDKIPHLG